MINKLSGHSAWELIEKHGMDVYEYCPEELDKLVSKKFLFKWYYSQYNVNNNNHTYKMVRRKGIWSLEARRRPRRGLHEYEAH
ncbi:hypothetical protein Tco_1179338 [Tanacetum coccineum]